MEAIKNNKKLKMMMHQTIEKLIIIKSNKVQQINSNNNKLNKIKHNKSNNQ